MRRLETEREQSALLPKAGTGLLIVLFYRSSDPSFSLEAHVPVRDESIARVSELVSVDLDGAPVLAERFALPVLPVLAAVFDGSILCIESDVSGSRYRELVDLALRQKNSLLEQSL